MMPPPAPNTATIYDLVEGCWIDPAIPGATAACNAIKDPKTPLEAKDHARAMLGYTNPLGWEAAPADEPRWVDALASFCLVSAMIGVIGLVVYVLTLPGVR